MSRYFMHNWVKPFAEHVVRDEIFNMINDVNALSVYVMIKPKNFIAIYVMADEDLLVLRLQHGKWLDVYYNFDEVVPSKIENFDSLVAESIAAKKMIKEYAAIANEATK